MRRRERPLTCRVIATKGPMSHERSSSPSPPSGLPSVVTMAWAITLRPRGASLGRSQFPLRTAPIVAACPLNLSPRPWQSH